jgi:Pyruvate/2-oxoacid:ferredoxin oxidoreductase delta subunit
MHSKNENKLRTPLQSRFENIKQRRKERKTTKIARSEKENKQRNEARRCFKFCSPSIRGDGNLFQGLECKGCV